MANGIASLLKDMFVSMQSLWSWFNTPLFTLNLSWIPIDALKNLNYEITPLFLFSTTGIVLIMVIWLAKLMLKWW